MEDNAFMVKFLLSGAVAAVGAYLRALRFPMALLVVVMALDYATGLARAWEQGTLSSKIGLRGILKKVSYLCVVAVAIVADWVVQIAAEELGVSLNGSYFCALIVAVWLILNECISILENVSEIGGPVPAFLVKFVAKLKNSTERKGEDANDEG